MSDALLTAPEDDRSEGHSSAPAESTYVLGPSGGLNAPKDKEPYPVVRTGIQLRELLEAATSVLVGANEPPVVYRRGGSLVRIQHPDDNSLPAIEPYTRRRLTSRLIGLADWHGERGPSKPPHYIVGALLDDPPADAFPALEAVTAVPVFAPSYDLICDPGFDKRHTIYFHDPFKLAEGLHDEFDVAVARDLLFEALHDFMFVDEASRAHALALIILPFIRPALAHVPTPLHLIESPTPGTGKGRLADLMSVIATNGPCPSTCLNTSRAENAKKLASMLAAGVPIIHLDNLPQERVLDDPVLASFLTAVAPTDRRLGGNRLFKLRNTAVWIATANNPRSTLELARRTVRIRLDARTDRPWLRTNFLHEDLLGWARERRRDLVHACVNLVRHWCAKGRPRWSGKPLGSFEEWTAVLGGILEAAEIPGFLGNLDQMYAEYDEEAHEWHALVKVWWRRHRQEFVRASDIHAMCEEKDLLHDVIGFGGIRSRVSRLGHAMQRNVDRIYGNYRIVREGGAVRSSFRYGLRRLENGGSKAKKSLPHDESETSEYDFVTESD